MTMSAMVLSPIDVSSLSASSTTAFGSSCRARKALTVRVTVVVAADPSVVELIVVAEESGAAREGCGGDCR